MPREGTARREAIALVCETPEAVVLFEAANRTTATLRDLADATPERRACVARELTKVHEEFVRGTLRHARGRRAHLDGRGRHRAGPAPPAEREELVDDAALDARIDEALARGEHAKAIAERLAAWSGRPKRLVYERVVARKGG